MSSPDDSSPISSDIDLEFDGGKAITFIVGIAGAAVVVLQLIGVIVACCLGRRMKELQNFV